MRWLAGGSGPRDEGSDSAGLVGVGLHVPQFHVLVLGTCTWTLGHLLETWAQDYSLPPTLSGHLASALP